VVVLKQHVIDPSPLLEDFTEGELHKHLDWIERQLKQFHDERIRRGTGNSKDAPVSGDTLLDAAKSAQRHRLVAELPAVLQRAKRAGRLWCSEPTWNRKVPDSYIVPNHVQRTEIIRLFGRFRVVSLLIQQREGGNTLGPQETLAHADTTVAASTVA